MKLIEKVLTRATENLPMRVINDGTDDYFERYYVGTVRGWRVYLHRFTGSDPDRGLHDHPWRRAFSIILSGWYVEERRTGTRQVRWFNSLAGDTFHRVVLPQAPGVYGAQPQPCWTLFAHTTPDVKPWGFLRKTNQRTGAMRFEPYTYAREGSQVEWWLTAKTRRQIQIDNFSISKVRGEHQ